MEEEFYSCPMFYFKLFCIPNKNWNLIFRMFILSIIGTETVLKISDSKKDW